MKCRPRKWYFVWLTACVVCLFTKTEFCTCTGPTVLSDLLYCHTGHNFLWERMVPNSYTSVRTACRPLIIESPPVFSKSTVMLQMPAAPQPFNHATASLSSAEDKTVSSRFWVSKGSRPFVRGNGPVKMLSPLSTRLSYPYTRCFQNEAAISC